MQPTIATIPAHVPPELVKTYPFEFGMTMDRDPYRDVVDELHKGPAIFYAPNAYPGGSGAWIVRRTSDLREVYFNAENFSSKDFSPFSKIIGETWCNVPAETDPPLHGLYRKLLNPLFTPKAMTRLEDHIKRYANDYVEGFRDKGACEFMADFAFEFPIKVFIELMGLPLERTAQFLEWEKGLLHSDIAGMAKSTRLVVDYLREEIDARRKNPKDDLITFGVQAEIDGRKLTEDELVGFMFNLFIGGLDTVSTNMGLHFRHLAEHAADQDFLRANPDRIADAVNELMRAYPAVTTFRTCSRETTINGVTFMPGDKVAMATALAGRDPEEYENPAEVRFDRKARNISFGYGPHLCVGMHLAQRELRIAMETMLRLIPPFRIKPGHVVRSHVGGMIQPVELPLVW